jgi:sec-independent protein translocase protein TatB
MFNLGGGELLVIALIALIVLGPERLPDAARTVGKVMGEVRKLSTGFQDEVRTAFSDSDAPATVTSSPGATPLAAEVAQLDEGRLDAADAGTRTPAAIEASATDVSDGAGAALGEAAPAELAPDVADALGEVLAGPGVDRPVLTGVDDEHHVDDDDAVDEGALPRPEAGGGEHRAAS